MKLSRDADLIVGGEHGVIKLPPILVQDFRFERRHLVGKVQIRKALALFFGNVGVIRQARPCLHYSPITLLDEREK